MPPILALLFSIGVAAYALATDHKRGFIVPAGLFVPTLWYLVAASRPAGVWLTVWGLPVLGGDTAGGSVTEQVFIGALAVFSAATLFRRRFSLTSALMDNRWLFALLALMAISILWSTYPYISFKRYIKIVASLLIALVILTNTQPLASILTVLRRCLYVHLPVSIVFVKYYRDMGVAWDWSGGASSWHGIATSKNTLGQIAMLGVLYFTWELFKQPGRERWRSLNLLYLLMAAYLLKGSEDAISLTSVAVTVFALILFFGIQHTQNYPDRLRLFLNGMFTGTIMLVAIVVIHSIVIFSEDSFFGRIITTFGRDITLTGRTDIWADVYAANPNALFGVGYGGFWIGREANIPWNADMTWVLGQGHSGYVDVYLQVGLLGCFLLAGIIFSSYRHLRDGMWEHFDFGSFRLAIFITIVFVNITETTFLRGDHHLWFMFLLAVWRQPQSNSDEHTDAAEYEPLHAPEASDARPRAETWRPQS